MLYSPTTLLTGMVTSSRTDEKVHRKAFFVGFQALCELKGSCAGFSMFFVPVNVQPHGSSWERSAMSESRATGNGFKVSVKACMAVLVECINTFHYFVIFS